MTEPNIPIIRIELVEEIKFQGIWFYRAPWRAIRASRCWMPAARLNAWAALPHAAPLPRSSLRDDRASRLRTR